VHVMCSQSTRVDLAAVGHPGVILIADQRFCEIVFTSFAITDRVPLTVIRLSARICLNVRLRLAKRSEIGRATLDVVTILVILSSIAGIAVCIGTAVYYYRKDPESARPVLLITVSIVVVVIFGVTLLAQMRSVPPVSSRTPIATVARQTPAHPPTVTAGSATTAPIPTFTPPASAAPTSIPLNPTNPPPSPQIVTHYVHGKVTQANALVLTTASCGSGEVLVSGGANVDGTLYSSYPINSNTWAAEGSGSFVGQGVDAYAVCVAAAGTMNTITVTSASVSISGGGDARITCPSDWLLVGGGYRISPPPATLFGAGGAFTVIVAGSTPMIGNNGWDVYALGESGEQLQTYAVCSQNGFRNVIIQTSSASIGPKMGGDIIYTCPGSTLLTSGGGADTTITSSQSMSVEGSLPTANGTEWDYRPYNYQDASQSHSGQIYVVCASF
jgi:hypothetical protein